MTQDDPFGDRDRNNDFGHDPDPANPYRPGDVTSAPKPTSGVAIASFVCGIVFCVPFLTSTLAIVFGIAGLRSTRSPYVGGRNWAIAGTVLGVVGLGFWLLTGAVGYMAVEAYLTEVKKAETVAVAFVEAISEGKANDAAELTTKSVDRQTITDAIAAIKASGPLNEILLDYQPMAFRGRMEFRAGGDVVYSRDRKRVSMTMVTRGDTYRIDQFSME